MNRQHELDVLIRAALKKGWRVTKGHRHWKVYPPDAPMITVSISPGSGGAVSRVTARFKRAGL